MIGTTNRARDVMMEAERRILPLFGSPEAGAIIASLFIDRFSISRVDLVMNPDLRLTESQIVQVYKDLQKLSGGMPLQYVTGKARFLDNSMFVDSRVLIPRPETEELVMICCKWLESKASPVVLDIGTGSGAIAVAIKKRIPGSQVFALDNSEEILEVARHNALINNAVIHFFKADVLSGVADAFRMAPLCIVSNPPYIPASRRSALDVNVRDFEPSSALFVPDEDPLLFFRAIGLLSRDILQKDGMLIVETDHIYNEEVADLFASIGLKEVTSLQDLSGKPRFVKALKNSN
jgi:release factor glutamine methyltransferase